MFIALYEFKIKPGSADVFRSAWLEVTKAIYQHCRSYGSRLHFSQEPDTLVGYAQWPSKAQWEKVHQIDDPTYHDARAKMLDCLIESKTVYELDVCDDYLQPSTC
ncbi:putative quinol monooxygenase [Vibrio viridaestus]|uniref:Antibiotic biosynthesis monooxygenase n=1 Tax=Vibrio viridaestus TaxID=2487322 RepID=A0A3N9TEG0_9VIBR|nr:antibiotic biosynthesis monooxygenase [Vibrio viridaestus]RQW62621.1 antibiotic biosynthesis monooxygenase [Vibrio viridaestus]